MLSQGGELGLWANISLDLGLRTTASGSHIDLRGMSWAFGPTHPSARPHPSGRGSAWFHVYSFKTQTRSNISNCFYFQSKTTNQIGFNSNKQIVSVCLNDFFFTPSNKKEYTYVASY